MAFEDAFGLPTRPFLEVNPERLMNRAPPVPQVVWPGRGNARTPYPAPTTSKAPADPGDWVTPPEVPTPAAPVARGPADPGDWITPDEPQSPPSDPGDWITPDEPIAPPTSRGGIGSDYARSPTAEAVTPEPPSGVNGGIGSDYARDPSAPVDRQTGGIGSDYAQSTTPPTSTGLPLTQVDKFMPPSGLGPDVATYGAPPAPSAAVTPGAPAPLDMPDDERMRTGGKAVDALTGDPQSGMLTGKEAYQQRHGRPARDAWPENNAPAQEAIEGSIAAAERHRDEARARVEAVRQDTGARAQDPAFKPYQRESRRLLADAEREFKEAEEGLVKARERREESQTGLRSKSETTVKGVAEFVTSTANNARGMLESLEPGASDSLRKRNPERAARLDENAARYRDLVKPLKTYTDAAEELAKSLAKPDPAQAEDFSTKLTEGAVSMGVFMAGGLAARGLRLSAAAGAGGLGALQMGGSSFKEVEDEITKVKGTIESIRAQGTDPSLDQAILKQEARLKELQAAKYVALYANMGLGATEAIPIERFLSRLDAATGHKVAHIIETTTKQTMEEVLQEVGQQIAGNIVANVLWDHQREIFGKDVDESGKIAAILGGGMGLFAGLTSRPHRAGAGNLAAGLPPLGAPLTEEEAPLTSGLGATPPLSSSNAAPSGAPSGAAPSAPTPPTPPATTAEEAAAQIAANPTRAGTTTITVNGKTVTVPPSGTPEGQPKDADETEATDWLTKPVGGPPDPQAASAPAAGKSHYDQAVDLVRAEGKGSTSYIQRKLGIGYGAAAKIMDQLEADGVVGPADRNTGKREVLPQAEEPAKTDLYKGQFTAKQTRNILTGNEQNLANIKHTIADPIEAKRDPEKVAHLQSQIPSLEKEIAGAKKFLAAGTRAAPIAIESDEDVARLGKVVRQDGSHAQGEANNIQREHADWHGLGVTIEAPAGGTRKGVAPDGTDWEQKFSHPYGYVKGIKGADGQELDAYMLGAEPQAFVLDELDENGKFRQHKIFLGARDSDHAREAYLGTQDKKAAQWGGGQMMTADEFKEWSKGDLTKPLMTDRNRSVGEQSNRTLRAYGYTQFQIDRMSEKNRLAEYADALKAGVKPEDFQESDAESAESAQSAQSSANDAGAKAEPAQESGNVGNSGRNFRPELASAGADVSPSNQVEKTNIRELEPENTPPVPEPAPEHVAAVEEEIRAEGEDPKADYLRGIAKRAAGLYAQHSDKGLTHRDAGRAAIAEEMINSGAITEDQAREHYGPKLLELLQAERGTERGVRQQAQDAPDLGANAANAKAPKAGVKAGQAEEHRSGVQAHGAGAAETASHPTNGRGDISAHAAATRPVENAKAEAGREGQPRQPKNANRLEFYATHDWQTVDRALNFSGNEFKRWNKLEFKQEDGKVYARIPADPQNANAGPFFDRMQEEGPVKRENTERQYVIPGAERISQAEYLARKASEPKRARKSGMRVRSRVKEIETEPFARDSGPDDRPRPRPKPPRPPAPMSAMTYLASRGGLQPDNELKKLDITYKTRVVVPGMGWQNVISKKRGMTMEEAVEVLMEGKYLPRDNARKPNDFSAHNKIRDMLADEKHRGVKTYPMGQEDTGEQTRHERDTAAEQLGSYEDEVRKMIAETDSARHITRADHFIRRAATIMATEGLSVDDAWHAAVMREDIDAFGADDVNEVFDLGDLDDLYPRKVQRDGKAPTQDGGQGEGPAEAAEAPGPSERVEDERGPRAQEEPAEEVKPATEKTAAGTQLVIPGAEKITKAEEAQRKADNPLKPKAAQKPADEGLFGDGHKQLDLVEQAAKAPEPPSVKDKPAKPAPTQTKPPAQAESAETGVVTDEAWWNKELTENGRSQVSNAASVPQRHQKMTWRHIQPDVQAKLLAVRGTEKDPATKYGAANQGDDAWWKDLSPLGREMVAAAAKAGKTVAKAAWSKIRPDVQAKLASIRDTDADPNVIRDAPTWAQVLHVFPKSPDGRPDMSQAADIFLSVAKKSKFDAFTPSEKTELLRKLTEARAAEQAKPAEQAPAPADNAPAMSVDEASRKVELAWTEYREIKKKLDKLDERLERKETPRNPLDKERIDKNYALTEKFARQERKKAAAAYDAWEDAKADLKKAKSAAQKTVQESVQEEKPAPISKPSVATSDEIPDFLLRNPKKMPTDISGHEAKAEEKDVSSIFDDIFDELAEEQKSSTPNPISGAEKTNERTSLEKSDEKSSTDLLPGFELLPPYKGRPGPPEDITTLKQWRVFAPDGTVVGIGFKEEALAGYENWKEKQEAKAEIAPEPTPAPKVEDYAKRAQAVLETSGDKGRGYHDIEKRVNIRIDVNLTRGTWPKAAEDAIYAAAREQFLRSVADKLSLDAIEDNMMTAATHAAEKGMPEHPGLVIKSLETGKTTTIQPKGTRKPSPKSAPAKSEWKEIGKNADGRTLYEDQRGVRSYVENGIRATEPVGIRPGIAGIVVNPRRSEEPEWNVAPERTAVDAAKSAAKNVSQGTSKALDGLMKLFDPKNKMSEGGLTFDDEDWKKAKPFFIEAAHDFRNAWKDIGEFARKLVQALRERGMSIEGLRAMRPYLERFTQDVKDGRIDLNAAPETTTSESESSDERTGPQETDQGRPDQAPSEPSAGPQEGGDAGGVNAGNGEHGPGGNGPADEAGVPGARSEGSGDAAAPKAGGRGRSTGLGGGRAGGAGAKLPRKPAAKRDERGREPVTPAQAPSLPAINFKITDELNLGKGGEVAKYNDNLAAIETLKTIEREHRRATPEEQAILAKYVGWGGNANAFRQPDTNEFKTDWKDRGERLEESLSKEEYRAARSSTQYAHYTSKTVIDAMWSAVQRLGFTGGLAVETSAGVGNFLGLVPTAVAGQTRFVAIEKDSVSARIAKLLYPQDTVLHAPFETVPLPDGEAALVIGNPPFSKHSLRFQNKPELTGESMHNQFILAGLDALRPGGLQVVVVSRYLMDAKDSSAREKMAAKANLIGAIRLPDTAFKENARTEVVTDILFFQRRTPTQETHINGIIEHSHRPPKGGIMGAITGVLKEKPPSWIETDTVRDPLGGNDMVVNKYFATNRNMIVGQLERSGTMQMSSEDGKGINVTLNGELAPRLAAAIATLPEGEPQHVNVLADMITRHKSMSDALTIALEGHEVGHVERSLDGKLSQISERETKAGDFELTRRELTPASPWSRTLSMAADGRWFSLEPQRAADGLQERLDEARSRLKEHEAAQNVALAEVARGQIANIEESLKKAKPDELAKNGKKNVYVRKFYEDKDVPASMRLGQAKYDRLVDIVNLRDLTKKQLTLEAQDASAAEMEGNRKKLAAAYKDYVAKNGLLNEARNTQIANDLPDGALVLALEFGYRAPITDARAARTGEKARDPSATPAPIMSRRVVPKYEPPTKAASVADALSIVLSEAGRIDVARVASLLGTDEEGAVSQLTGGDTPLAYFNPETKTYETRNAYLSGQVAKKLAAAKVAGLTKNAADLTAVMPARWSAENVTAILGSNWIPAQHYEAFAKHVLGTDKATVHYSAATNAYNMLVGDIAPEKQDAFGTTEMPADAILRGILNSRVPKVSFPDENGTPRIDHELTALVALKAKEIENEFADWVFKDGARRNELVDIYNEKFNTRVTRQHDGSHLVLPGKVPVIKLRRHQKNAVWRGIYERFMLLDHVVGAGKTFTAIARAMERRRMGLSRKPMVVVPNHLVDQWTADVYRLYPAAKVLAAGKTQFTKQNRRRLFARIATGDWDIIIIPHSSFGFISIDPATELRFLEKEMRVAVDAVKEAEENSDMGGRFKPFTVKQAEALVEKIEARINSIKNAKTKDRMLTFEQMGVDDLTVDEAHEFKNLFYSSRLTGVSGMGDKGGSQKAFDLYNKVHTLRESPTGTVTFMTGTPISNSAVEMYTMMRYLAADELADLGLENFDAWRAQSVTAAARFEPTDSGSGLKEVTRLGRSWSNMRSLMELYYSFTDAVSQDDINRSYAEDNNGARFPVPKVKGGGRQRVVVKPTDAQVSMLAGILEGFNNLPNINNPKDRNVARLKLMDAGRKVSLDIRAIDPSSESKEVGGKLDQISDQVARIYKASTKDRGTQLIFLDRGVKSSKADAGIIKEYDDLVARRAAALAEGKEDTYRALTDKLDEFNASEIEELRRAQKGGWNAYDQLKENLVKRGIPADQIRFIQEANNDAEKKALFDLVKEGTVRVLIGSTPKMGAGTNVQDRMVGLHHGDVTWKPSDIEQREGRIIRQDNLLLEKYGPDNFEIEILAYATERTVDAKMWDLNSEKLKMINGIRKYDGAFNMEFEDEEAVGMAEMAAIASGDPLLLERVKLMSAIDKMELLERAHRRKVFGIEDSINELERAQRDYPGMIETGNKKAAIIKEGLQAMLDRAGERFVRVEGKPYSTMVDAVKAANEAIEIAKGGDENARYSINVDGQRITNKAGIEEAIENALGDKQAIEVVRKDGETWRRRSQVAKELSGLATAILQNGKKGEGGQHGGNIGTMAGFDLNWGVSRAARWDTVSLWLERDDKMFVDVDKTVDHGKMVGEFSVQQARSLVSELAEATNNESRFANGEYFQSRLDEAERRLPQLRQDYATASFPKQAELDAARARLEELIRILDAQAKAAERRGGSSSDTDEPLDPNTPAANRAIGPLGSKLSAEQQQTIIQNITEIARLIGGPNVSLRFHQGDRIPDAKVNSEGWGGMTDPVIGRYFRGLIELALEDPTITTTVLHEIYHHIEATLQDAKELALMTSPREMKRMRRAVQSAMNFSDKEMAGLAGYEVRAIAFQIYARDRIEGKTLHVGIRRFFDKVSRFISKVANFLQQMGYRTADDIFGKAFEGKYAKQKPVRNNDGWFLNRDTSSRDAPLSGDEEAFARAPKRFRPVRANYQPQLPQPHFTPLHTSMRAALNDPNMSRTERYSAALGALLLPAAREFWDKLIDITRLQRAAELFNGARISQRLDTMLAATLYPGIAGERLKDASYELFRPIYDAMKAHNVHPDELHDFLYARHAKERNDFVGAINPVGSQFHNAITDHSLVGASGMSTDDAIDILRQIAPRRADFDAVAALVDAVKTHNQNLIDTEGLEHPSTLMHWNNAYSFYVPLQGEEAGAEDEHGSPPRGKGYSTRGPESMRAMGRLRRADDILAHLLDQTQRLIIRAEKNRVAKTFARFAMANPNPDLYKIGLGTTRRGVNPTTGLVEIEWVTTPAQSERAFAFKVAGDTHYIEFTEGQEGLLLALKNLGMPELGMIGKALQWFTRTYSAFQTARNPEFVITNFLRDIQDAGVALTAEQQAGFEIAYLKRLGGGRAALSAVLGQVGATNNQWGQLYEEWRHDGGKISAFGYKDLQTIKSEIREEMTRRTESMTKKVILNTVLPWRVVDPMNGHIVRLFEALSDITESTTRLAVYAAARDIGLSRAEAARASREMTVDFSRGGRLKPWLQALWAFSSPAIQGPVNMMRRLRKSRNFRYIYGVGVPSTAAMLTFYNMWASPGDDDDKDKKLYEEMKYWEREKNIVIYFPGDKDPIKLPLGFLLKPAWMIGENAAMVMMGKITPGAGLLNIIGTTANAFNPFGAEGSAFDLAFWLKTLAPTFADPLVELVRNRNWLDRPIHPDERPWNSGVPHSEQSKMTTSPHAETAAQWLNSVTGGNPFTKGKVDLYPDDLEHAWNFVLGGYGRFLLNSSDFIKDKIDGVDTPTEKLPFVRRFVSEGMSHASRAEKYYEDHKKAYDDTQAIRAAYRASHAGTNTEAAQKTIDELFPKTGAHPTGQFRQGVPTVTSPAEKTFRDADSELKTLRLQERALRRNREMPRNERVNAIKAIRKEQLGIMKGARVDYRELQPQP